MQSLRRSNKWAGEICALLLVAACAGCDGDDAKRGKAEPPRETPVTFFWTFEDEKQARAAAEAAPAGLALSWGRVKAGEWLICASRPRALPDEEDRLSEFAKASRGRDEGWQRSRWPPGTTCVDEIYARQRS